MEELEKTLAAILKKSMEIASQTGEFVMEQAPMLLQEFYQWHLAKNIFFVILFPLIFYIIYSLFKYAGQKELDKYEYPNKMFNRYYDWEDVWPILGMVVIFIYGIVGLIQTFISIYNIIFILVAPKIYLIEYFMISSGSC